MFRLAPAPRDGEMLYSVLARLGGYLNASVAAPFIEGLLGRRAAIASPDLPGGLATLVRDIDGDVRDKAMDRIIDRLTAFPFHTAFVPADVRADVRAAMGGDMTGVYTRLGLAAFKVRQPDRLRFCPDCLDAMERDHADLWWRREHQLSGVVVCAVHGTVLRHSDVGIGERNRHSFVSASRHVCRIDAEPVVQGVGALELTRLAELARAAFALLDRPPPAEEHADRQAGYRRRLAEVGLMRSPRLIDVAALHEAFRAYWGEVPEIIDGLAIATDSERSWLTALVRGRARAAHPIQHLMLSGMLDALGAVQIERPFGTGPWPCRNPAADHHRQDVIDRVAIRHDRGTAYGDFACGCGYLYTVARTADGAFGEPRYRRFGPLLSPALLKAVQRGDGLRATAKALGLDPKTLMREARIAGVAVPWSTRPSGSVPVVRPPTAPTVRPRRPTPRRRLRNWFAIDARLARAAAVARAAILAEAKPVRVTFAEIERRIARRDWIVKRRAKLPRTIAVIEEAVEAVDTFRHRRLSACVAAAIAAGDLRPCEVMRVAGLPSSWLPVVRQAVEAAAQPGRFAA